MMLGMWGNFFTSYVLWAEFLRVGKPKSSPFSRSRSFLWRDNLFSNIHSQCSFLFVCSTMWIVPPPFSEGQCMSVFLCVGHPQILLWSFYFPFLVFVTCPLPSAKLPFEYVLRLVLQPARDHSVGLSRLFVFEPRMRFLAIYVLECRLHLRGRCRLPLMSEIVALLSHHLFINSIGNKDVCAWGHRWSFFLWNWRPCRLVLYVVVTSECFHCQSFNLSHVSLR